MICFKSLQTWCIVSPTKHDDKDVQGVTICLSNVGKVPLWHKRALFVKTRYKATLQLSWSVLQENISNYYKIVYNFYVKFVWFTYNLTQTQTQINFSDSLTLLPVCWIRRGAAFIFNVQLLFLNIVIDFVKKHLGNMLVFQDFLCNRKF